MFIKRFFVVLCIVSFTFFVCIIFKEKIFKSKENINYEDILFEIYIPRINLRNYVYNIDSNKNNVDKNISILPNSNLNNNLYFIASHSGGGKGSYFDNLIFLDKGDIIWLNNYTFVIEDIFYIEKNGYFDAFYTSNMLYLITCSLDNKGKQLVIKSKLFYIDKANK